ncbi:MAG: L-2-hydroxyglutarate oxidase [Balneolales bacterium]
MQQNYDVIVIGAGIVGLATAYKLLKKNRALKVAVLDKEGRVAKHQTGRNSGVIHSGIYYKPGSSKARNCLSGRHQMVEFCREHNIRHDVCGKVIVAVNQTESERLDAIYKRGIENKIEGIRKLDRIELLEIEPHVNGIEAIHVPCAGIVDFVGVCQKLQELINEMGGNVLLNQPVKGISSTTEGSVITTRNGKFNTKFLINCAGLFSDRIAEKAGLRPPVQIVPFRGEYFKLTPQAKKLVKNLVYPLPNPEFPFLGVHFTRMVIGDIECGPNAVFAFKREGYGKLSIQPRDLAQTLAYPGFWRMAGRHWRMGLDEIHRSFSKKAFLRELQKLIPVLTLNDIIPAPSGVRAMALDRQGNIIDDFSLVVEQNQIHVLNAPSPAATAGLALGDDISNLVEINSAEFN